MSISISVDRTTNPPTLRLNGVVTEWRMVASLPPADRKAIRKRLSAMTNGKRMVAWTMPGAAVPK